jgi:triacylglycerol lipase
MQFGCKDTVVLVHGNTATPASWDNTYNLLLSQGYSSADIYRPDWGSKYCASCNNHSGSEETPVRQAINDAIANSCSGQIDVIGHSMGATLAAQQISKLAAASYVDTFVGVAGAFRGLYSCGIYPFKSNIDQVVCATGVCVVYGVHSSSIWNEDASFTYSLGHFGLQTDTSQKQIDLIQ